MVKVQAPHSVDTVDVSVDVSAVANWVVVAWSAKGTRGEVDRSRR
jgi:hypothetical protein